MAQLDVIAPTAPVTLREQLLSELAPSGILQRILVEQLARGVDRLDRAAALENPADPANPAWLRYQAQAERTFYKALAEFRRLAQAESTERAPTAKPKARPEPATPPPSPTVVARPPRVGDPADWRSRVDRGPAGDYRWPVLSGSDVKVDDIMSLLEERWTEAELLVRYPDLDLDDILTCRACDAEGGAGPCEPPAG